MTVLLREAIGDRLRHTRTNQRRTLREVSRSARVSLGYLSEVERGRKEASSELLAAICDALDLPLAELMSHVASDISALTSVEHGVPEQVPAEARAAAEHGETGTRAAVDAGRLVPAVVGDSLADLRLQPLHSLDSLGGARAFAAA
ncbi:helix-turn-helix domain-containing protein [Actinokineospora sp. NPDC004072]